MSTHRERDVSDSKVFFAADLHFGHGNIIKYSKRPFLSESDKRVFEKDGTWEGSNTKYHRISDESVKLMNDTLIDNINATVGENDILWFLGDWCFVPRKAYYQHARSYRDRIKCKTINLVYGNHDHDVIYNLFNRTCDLCEIEINRQKIILCHYAMAIWDRSHRGAIHLYGHSHSEAESWLDQIMPGRRSMDVGVDNAAKLLGEYRPFSADEVLELMSKRPGHSIGDHHSNRT